jgi:hypothetical protein
VGGWELTGIATLQGGTRATPSLSFSLGRTATNSRPDIVGDPTQGVERQPYAWINPAAFSVPTNAQIAAGLLRQRRSRHHRESGAGKLRHFRHEKYSVEERVRIQFRREFFNASVSDPRVVQLG